MYRRRNGKIPEVYTGAVNLDLCVGRTTDRTSENRRLFQDVFVTDGDVALVPAPRFGKDVKGMGYS